jgi:hypothetical protein
MSQENVELVRRATEAFNARVPDRDTELVLGAMHPDIEFRSVTERKVYRGITGMRQYARTWKSPLPDFTPRAIDSWMPAKTASSTCIAWLGRGREAVSR